MQDIYRAGKAKAIGLSSSVLGHRCTFRRNSPVYGVAAADLRAAGID
jgi:hypothetical protein